MRMQACLPRLLLVARGGAVGLLAPSRLDRHVKLAKCCAAFCHPLPQS